MIPETHIPTIAIIGGGFSGTLLAVHLLQNAYFPLTIKLIERKPIIGQGVAYSTQCDSHLLNVPAGKMSAFPDEPNHFLNWLNRQAQQFFVTADSFVPRKLYGEYIRSILAEAERNTPIGVRLERIIDEAITLKVVNHQVLIGLNSGKTVLADRGILALGNFPPVNPPVVESSFYQSHRYISWAWSTKDLPWQMPDEPILLVGSGLTAIDMIMGFYEQRHQGKIYAVSRHGVFPQPHEKTHPYPLFLDLKQTSNRVRDLLRFIRQEVDSASARGYDWRSVIDALRSHTPTIWRQLSLTEKRRFLRHVRPYWESHRHRMAPVIAQKIQTLQDKEQLVLYAGSIVGYSEDYKGVDVFIRKRKSREITRLRVSLVINCTGSQCNYRSFKHPLILDLLNAGLARPDQLGLGLDITRHGALIEENGEVSNYLYTLGPPRKGFMWETTAVPEIREQAKILALELLRLVRKTPKSIVKVANY